MKSLYWFGLNFKVFSESSLLRCGSVFQRNRKQLENQNPKKADIKNKKGQVTAEYILLAVALIALFQIATVTLKDNDSLKNFQETPGKIFKNLVENGNWIPNERQSRARHPTHHERHYTPNGKGPK